MRKAVVAGGTPRRVAALTVSALAVGVVLSGSLVGCSVVACDTGGGQSSFQAALAQIAATPVTRSLTFYDDTSALVKLAGTGWSAEGGFAALRGTGTGSLAQFGQLLASDPGINLLGASYTITAGRRSRLGCWRAASRATASAAAWPGSAGPALRDGWSRRPRRTSAATSSTPRSTRSTWPRCGSPARTCATAAPGRPRRDRQPVRPGAGGRPAHPRARRLPGGRRRRRDRRGLPRRPLQRTWPLRRGERGSVAVPIRVAVAQAAGVRVPVPVGLAVRCRLPGSIRIAVAGRWAGRGRRRCPPPAGEHRHPHAVVCATWRTQAAADAYASEIGRLLPGGVAPGLGVPYSRLLAHPSVRDIGGSQHLVAWQADTPGNPGLALQMTEDTALPALPDCAHLLPHTATHTVGCGV